MNTLRRLLVLLAIATAPGAAPADDGQRGRAPAHEFTLVTLNLYHDRDDWPRRRVQIVEELRRLRPDAIALQEVLQHEDLPNQAVWLARELGYDWHFTTTDPPSSPRRFGNALLVRGTVLERGETLLHPLEDHRTAGLVRVLAGDRPLNLYVTHLHWTPEGGAIRERQVQDLLAWIEATSEGLPVVIAGDFNATSDAPELAALHRGHVDAWQALHPHTRPDGATTLNPHYFERRARIDHVFLERGRLQPVEARRLFTAPDAGGVWASDHFGLYVRFRVLPEPAD